MGCTVSDEVARTPPVDTPAAVDLVRPVPCRLERWARRGIPPRSGAEGGGAE